EGHTYMTTIPGIRYMCNIFPTPSYVPYLDSSSPLYWLGTIRTDRGQIFALWAEDNVPYASIMDNVRHFPSSGRLPHPDDIVCIGCNQILAIRAEDDTDGTSGMRDLPLGRYARGCPAASHLPHPHRLVHTSRGQVFAIRAEGKGGHIICMRHTRD